MDLITIVMLGFLVALGIVLFYMGWLAISRSILFKLGVRNIPRRPTQSILIMIGLTLSTIIIVSSLSMGDTLNYSVQRQAVNAYGQVDEILAPPLISMFTSLDIGAGSSSTSDEANADSQTSEETQQLEQLMAGGLPAVLTFLEGGLPGITEERFEQLKVEAEAEPLIDAVAGSILFPTILRDVNNGQSEPLGFIFAVDDDYDQQFGLTTVEGDAVEIEDLQAGIGSIFSQATNLFTLIEAAGQQLGLENFRLSDIAVGLAAVGLLLTNTEAQDAASQGVDLAELSVDLETLRSFGIDTTVFEEYGLEEISLEALQIDPAVIEAIGIPTTTLSLETFGITTDSLNIVSDNLLSAINLNTLGTDLDQTLSQVGLQLRQGDVYLNRIGAERLKARVGDVLEIYIGPLPLPFRVRAIIEEAGPVGALLPVVMMRLSEAQQLVFMQGKVNNVLISNLGDELTGVEHTEAVSERLRVLAMDPETLAEIVAILRQPAIKSVIDAQALKALEALDEEFDDAPPIIVDTIQSFSTLDEAMQQVETLPAELDKEGISEPLRSALGNREVREWLLDLPLPQAEETALRLALAEVNQFDLIEPLNKSTILTVTNAAGGVFTAIFSLFGLLSILAGVLLIFLIFVLLAAARRSEIGIARAIGAQRSHIVQMFIAEGLIYDLVSAMVGVALGLTVSYTLIGFLGQLFNDVSAQVLNQSTILQFYFRATPTSLVIAYCAGVLFTFIVISIASWRVSRLNIVVAIRDLPEQNVTVRRAWWGNLLRLLMAVLILAGGWYLISGQLTEDRAVWFIGLTLLIVGGSFLLGWLLQYTPLRTEQRQRIVYTIIGLGLLGLWGAPSQTWLTADDGPTFRDDFTLIIAGFALTGPVVILGAILVVMFNADAWAWGISRLLGGLGPLTPVLKTAIAYPLSQRFRTGMTMLLFAIVISTVTIMSVVIRATQTIVTPEAERYAGFEIQVSPSLLSAFSPVADLRAAIAAQPEFPQALVAEVGSVFEQFVNVRIAEASAGRWSWRDVVGVTEGYINQAEQTYDLALLAPGYESEAEVWQALRERDDVVLVTSDLLDEPENDGVNVNVEANLDGENVDPDSVDQDNVDQNNEIQNSERRRRGRWRRLRLEGISLADERLPEIYLDLRTAEFDEFDRQQSTESPIHTVQVIGVIAQETTLAGEPIQVNMRLISKLTGEPVIPENHYVKVSEDADVPIVAQAIERAFVSNALNTSIMAENFATGQAVIGRILQLFQGFMALGLLVGLAALGVISSCTVVERRQQVGMLRAIGFQPNMVGLSFLLESSFIALTGIIIGTSAGLILGQSVVNVFLTAISPEQAFTLPWGQIGLIVFFAYLFALLTTLLPAYQAARIYPAEALRYE